MSETFTAEFFEGNRARLREIFTGTAPIVVTANGQLQRSGDTTFPFQQDTNFWYLTGIDEPDVILVMDKAKEYLIVPPRSEFQDIFDGYVSHESLGRLAGITEVLAQKEGWKRLNSRLKKAKHVATLAANPPYIETYGMYTNPARAMLIGKMKEVAPNIEILDLRQHLARMRVVKQQPEIQAITNAVDITVAAFKKVQKKRYSYEYELEADLSQLFRKTGAQGHAYDPIVASGKNACIMHYLENKDPIAPTNLILVDAGAAYDHYAADISRTWSQQKPTARQRAVIAAVNEATEFALGQLKPGIPYWNCEQNVRNFVGEKLRELGLIKTIDKQSVATYYPHAPHYLGLDIHDVGDYRTPLQPGMVLTVEPGIYIPKEGIGVRIEEDILITSNGYTNLSAQLPREL